MKSYFFLITVIILFQNSSSAQSLSPTGVSELEKKEDTLKVYADSMINALEAPERFRADSNFVRGLVRALKTKHSFYYPFDSIRSISRLYAPDSSFRIFTWQLKRDEYVYLQKGAIQVNAPDGSLKLFPLFDYSMFTAKPTDSVRSKENWIGAIYYRIVMKQHTGKKYYTLLGFDDYSISSNRKWMEVLTFNSKGEPVFGGPLISYKNDSVKKAVQARFHMEYKKEANTLLNYDPELDMVIFDHLISETDEPQKKNTYIPDGSYEGFTWKDGQWVHVDKVFDFQLQDGQFPVDEKIRDDQGNINEKILEDASRKNVENQQKKDNKKK